MLAGERAAAGRPHRAGVATVLRLAVRLARDDGWSSDIAGRRLARAVGDPSVLRAARARVVQATAKSEMVPTMRRVLETFDRALGAVPADGTTEQRLVAS